jgi:hypothetical protein
MFNAVSLRRVVDSYDVRRCPVCFLPLDASKTPISKAFKKHALAAHSAKQECDRVNKIAEDAKAGRGG